eukprot:TRINITY_DN6867_c0_g2_i1.p2 TRINITY_DN6867_c0_g2~~TRINITY_DN6867_c0_g2_i1.p2  ORF type:complete len:163 (-),score=51.22 TRINITY_DN6867_c0_g2_i1:570-1058(-)
MVSDAELAHRLTAILERADHSTTTPSTIRQRLEKELAVDLTSKKGFIRKHIDSYLQQQQQQNSEGGGGEVQGEVEDEQQGSEVDEAEAEAEVDENVEKGEEEEQDSEEEEGGKQAAREKQPEPESKRMRAKIDRAIKNRAAEDNWGERVATNTGGETALGIY